jgi:transposase
MTVYQHFIGIDIGKNEVVVGMYGSKSTKTYPNTIEGIKQFFDDYTSFLENSLVILETTGGYEKLYLNHLVEKNISVHRANTRQVKAFIRSLGVHGKTDALDALALARYGCERQYRLAMYRRVDNIFETLKHLAQRRLDLNQLLVQEKNREKAPDLGPLVKQSCLMMIECIKNQLKFVLDEMTRLMHLCPELEEKKTLLQEIPGIGEITSLMLVVLLPECGTMNRRQIASLTGLAPYPNDSGARRGHRCTKGGRQEVRNILFMAGMSAAHSKSDLGEKYRHFLEKGKQKMVALVAIMRKIIVRANAKLKELLLKKELVVAK